MKSFSNFLTLVLLWVVSVAVFGFTAGATYGLFMPFFKMGAALLGS